jgi:hypothetical protein
VDPQVFPGGELCDELVLYEELDDLFAQAPGCKGLDGRSFPLEFEEDMVDGLLVHLGVTRGGNFAGGVGRGDGGFTASCGCVVLGGWGLIASPNRIGLFLDRPDSSSGGTVSLIGSRMLSLLLMLMLLLMLLFLRDFK